MTARDGMVSANLLASMGKLFSSDTEVSQSELQHRVIVRGFRSLVEVESTYWGVVKLFNMQNKLMYVHQSDISKILLFSFHLKLSFLYAH